MLPGAASSPATPRYIPEKEINESHCPAWEHVADDGSERRGRGGGGLTHVRVGSLPGRS